MRGSSCSCDWMRARCPGPAPPPVATASWGTGSAGGVAAPVPGPPPFPAAASWGFGPAASASGLPTATTAPTVELTPWEVALAPLGAVPVHNAVYGPIWDTAVKCPGRPVCLDSPAVGQGDDEAARADAAHASWGYVHGDGERTCPTSCGWHSVPEDHHVVAFNRALVEIADELARTGRLKRDSPAYRPLLGPQGQDTARPVVTGPVGASPPPGGWITRP